MSTPHATRDEPSSSYWSRTRQPLTCLVFLLPLLALYEAGVLWLGGRDADAIRNGADYWMRGGLESLGLTQDWLLPGMIVVGLLVWHLGRQEPWTLSANTLAGMLFESVLFACVLAVVGQLQDYAYRHWDVGNWHSANWNAARESGGIIAAIVPDRAPLLAVVYVGAGIYEEVLFRLCLLPVCYGVFRAGRLGHGWSTGLAIIATSLAFSLAHYVGPAGEAFQLFSFGFRTLAGLFFAALFVLRGFGITVGAHAAYDLIVGLLLAGST
jgi:membrane protease YdiL (CAAX protease family)